MSVDGADLGMIDTGFPVVDDVTYSPDGRTLAFWGSEARVAKAPIFTKPVDGSGPAKQMIERAPDGTLTPTPSWSPDGSKIAFRRVVARRQRGRVTAQIYRGQRRRLGPRAAHRGDDRRSGPDLVAERDADRLQEQPAERRRARKDNQIWVINADGSGLKELGVGSPGTGDGAPAWGHR